MSALVPFPVGATDLLKAVAKDDKGRIASLLAGGADPDECDAGGVAPVILAAYLNRPDVLDLLAAHGASYPRFSAIEDIWEYGKPERFDRFRARQNQIVEVSQAAIVHGNHAMLERILSLPGAARGLLKKSALEAWGDTHFTCDNRHLFLGQMCAKIIGARLNLSAHDPSGLSRALTAFYEGMETGYNNRCDDIPHWETEQFSVNRSGLLSLPFSFWSVMANLDREYISRIKTNDDYDDTGIRFEWQPDEHSYVIAEQIESGPSSADNDDGYARLNGRLVYSADEGAIARIADMLASIRENNVEGLKACVEGALDPYCGFGSAEEIAKYALDHGANRILQHLFDREEVLHSSEVLNRLGKDAIERAHFAASYAYEMAYIEPDDPHGASFISDLDYDKTHDVVSTVVASANSLGLWLRLEDFGRSFLKLLLEERPARHQELMEQLFVHLDAAPGLMEKVDSWGDQTGSLVRAWRAKSAIDRVLKSAEAAGASSSISI